MTLAAIASATSGTLCDAPDPHLLVTGPTTSDSREITPGGMFAAITGALTQAPFTWTRAP